MPDAPKTDTQDLANTQDFANTQDLANTEYDAQRRARAGATHQPGPPAAPEEAPRAPSDGSPPAGPQDGQGSQHG